MLKRLILITFSFLLSFNMALADDLKIAFVDIDGIISQSIAGKEITKTLNNLNNKNSKKFKEKEKKLVDEENNIIKQKNILSKEDLDIKIKTLQGNVINFKKDVNIARADLDKKRLEATAKLINVLNIILSEYSKKNSISLIIQKKNIVIGKTELDITSQILKLVNAKIKNVKLN